MNNEWVVIKKKVLQYCISCLSSIESEGVPIEQFMGEFITKGTEMFESEEIVFGEKEIVQHHIPDVLSTFIYGLDIPNAIKEFEREKTEKHFKCLLGAYYKDVLLGIFCQKEGLFLAGKLHTDISLSVILCAGFFNDKLNMIAEHLDSYLSANSQKIFGYSIQSEYGRSSILYLAAFILGIFGNAEAKEKILKFCTPPHPAYITATDNLYSDDAQIVNDWVNQLAEFHISNSKEDHTFAFNREYWQYFPVEIIALLQLRSQKGLPIDFITHPLLKDFLPFIAQQLPIPLDETTQQLEKRILEK
ncbi:hypothetical protein SRABI27_01702 [Pedobacter sp. Bi27]|nr:MULTISPECIES: hypothetical protein [unclassified Pedobacter]CAH0175106.1 hypothetical protein SRABI36_01364 [Pedobacter sp. Bi36]CAH0199315.1 hypothetical protein SRABI27_01702 [Pedobacter sp. Bi27]CAH0231065.1 hypothetical protein SRABI126_02457 [Pedobacter sp. Bi126]